MGVGVARVGISDEPSMLLEGEQRGRLTAYVWVCSVCAYSCDDGVGASEGGSA